MGALTELISGFATALTPTNLLYAFIGVLLGTAIGVLPGIGPAMTIALLLPITYGIDDPVPAFIMFAGIYYGGMYGGSTTSILLNTPGESASVVTAIEGNKMAKRGRAAQALATAAIGSFVAGTIGTLLVALLAPAVVRLAVQLGAPDLFAIMVLAFVAVTSVLGSSRVRGFASLLLGLTIGLIGIDGVTGQQRLTYGIPQLADGIDVVVVAVGLFAVGEALWVAAHLRRNAAGVIPTGRARMGREDWGRSWKPWLRGTAVGFPFGAVPAGGAELPTFLSYVMEKRLAKRPEEFGHGAIEGVAGPEATNNASAAGGLVPLLTLGLPTTATAAVLLAAFEQYGIQPGPLLLENEPELVWGLLASLFIGNAILLVLNLPLAPMWAKLLHIPRPYLYAGILFFASVGAYAVNASTVDLMVLYAIGLLGFAMRRFGLPVMPAVIGVILGPRAEVQMRRALQISDGEIGGLFNTPFALTVYAIIAILVLWPLADRFVLRRFRRPRHELHGSGPHALVELAEEIAEEDRPKATVPGGRSGAGPDTGGPSGEASKLSDDRHQRETP
ncbi:tripartite tricarboxylate transporter permease [Sphaerisporangium album]|uniref:tripartite tricarboxylate transporter permease n=1 Tax=Sphaerisporangium album TaxID=509200 RepID=UPI001C68DC96|nr:tripartite tricarboxylate transporter permease [Sphaerisporangium album]